MHTKIIVWFFILSICWFPKFTLASDITTDPVTPTEIDQAYIDNNSSITTSSGPYILTTDIVIPKGKELVVEAGTALQFIDGHVRVEGTLKLQGDSLNPVFLEFIEYGPFESAFDVYGGNLYFQFVKVSSGEGRMIESVGGKVEIIHSHFENVQSRGSFITVFEDGTLTMADNSLVGILTRDVIELFNNSHADIRQTSFENSGNKSVLSIFEGWGVKGSSVVLVSDSVLKNFPAKGIEVFNGASVVLDRVSITEGQGAALTAESKGNLEVRNSSIERNNIGLESFDSTVVLNNNSIEGNRSGGISAYQSTVDAKDNWWGNESGPLNEKNNPTGTGQSVTDEVVFSPWLKEKPGSIICCSSVLFIPGLEGSRLYVKGWTENQLWEPNKNADVKKLYLDQNGKSIEQDVYTRDVIGKTNVAGPVFQADIYESFFNFMKSLVSKNTINAWKALPYDWRYSTDKVASEVIDLEKGATTSLAAAFDELANNSKTGKVSIVAHSNGGLVAKNFIRDLIASGKGNLIDQLILVAVPENGTPQTIADMLHGDSQSILGGLILSKNTARNLGMNMSSAYGLLPSQKFFNSTETPVIKFNDGSVSAEKYGSTLTNREQVDKFLVAAEGERRVAENTNEPAILNSGLLNKSEELHQEIDNMFSGPSPITSLMKVTNLVGIGNPTLTGIVYKYLKKGIERTRITSNDGDGIVVAGKPAYRSGDVYSVDMRSLSLNDKKNYKHINIMNASSVQKMISALIVKDISTLPAFVSKQASSSSEWKRYEFSVHSPVSIMAYDAEGNRTGLVKLATEDEVGSSVEDIPGSQYVNFGEAKTVITATLPQKIVLEGLDTGTFRFTATEFQGENVLKSVEYSNVPTIEGMIAEFIPASSSGMTIDYNSDGSTDQNLLPDNQSIEIDLDPAIILAKKEITEKVQSEHVREKYIRELNEIQKFVQKENTKKAAKELNKTANRLADALKSYGFVQKKLHIKKSVETAMSDTMTLYFQFQRLNSMASNLAEPL